MEEPTDQSTDTNTGRHAGGYADADPRFESKLFSTDNDALSRYCFERILVVQNAASPLFLGVAGASLPAEHAMGITRIRGDNALRS